MGRVMYSANGEGRWWRTEWQPQCETKLIFGQRCQGTAGHADVHWAFEPDGSFAWDDNDDDPSHNGGGGTTPPGHREYRSPVEMSEHHYLRFRECVEVTDPEIIDRLEDDDPPEGWDVASINKPLSEDDPFYEEAMRRLEEYEREQSED